MIRWTQADVDLATKKTPATSIRESAFQAMVMRYATQTGWTFYHTHNSIGSAAGFPDLCLVRGDRLIFAELKTEQGRVSVAQRKWLDALKKTPVEVYLFRPSDINRIIGILR